MDYNNFDNNILEESYIFDEKSDFISETALLSEAALSEDWNRPEEEEAWSHLQKVR